MKQLAWISALRRLRSWSHHFVAKRRGKSGSNDRFFFLGSKITEVGDCSHDIQGRLLLGRKATTNLNTVLKAEISLCRQRTHKAMDFPVVMYGRESWIIKESWALKNWCFQTVVLVMTLESPLDCKEIQPVHPKGDQSSIFFGRTDAEAETPILWPSDAKSWLIGKDPDAGKDWGQEEKGTTEGEMAGWHHRLNGHEFEWTPGVGDGQGGLVCCDSWGCKESDTTERLNWTDAIYKVFLYCLWKYVFVSKNKKLF